MARIRITAHRGLKSRLLAATGLGAWALTQLAAPAAAQPAPAAQVAALEEIVVTARKREENLQAVPLAITAFTAEAIEKQGVTRLRDVANLTPGLVINDFGAGTLVAPIIRGLSVLTGGTFSENNVSVFIDGVYVFTTYAVDASLADIERIEIVKGPVSALYGRNAYSGAINYVTKRPTDATDGKAEIRAGSDGLIGVSAAVGGPIIEGKLRARLAGNYEEFDGTFEDKVSGVKLGGHKKRAIQGSLDIQPAENFDVFTTLYYSDDVFDQPARKTMPANCGGPAGGVQTQFCGRVPDADELPPIESAALSSIKLVGNDRQVFNGVLKAGLTTGVGRFESLTGYQQVDIFEFRSFDSGNRTGLPYTLVGAPAGTVNLSSFAGRDWDDESFSQELRFRSPDDNVLRITGGGFYSKFKRDQRTFFSIDGSRIPAGRTVSSPAFFWITSDGRPSPNESFIQLEDKEVSGFAGLEYDVTDQLQVSAEARRSKQTKFINNIRVFPGFFTGAPGVDPDGANGVEQDWKFWSWRATADYKVNDDVLLYAAVGRGNKAGGFNVPAPTDPRDFVYGPEKNITYEVGTKATWLDGQLRTNLAVFYADLKDIQITGLPTDPTRPGAFIRNAAAADAKGFELEASAALAEGVSVTFGLAYTDPSFTSGSILASTAEANACLNIASCASRVVDLGLGRRGINLAGLQLPRSSKWQVSPSFDVTQPLTGDWSWFLRGDYRHDSKRFNAANSFNFVGTVDMMNLRAGVETEQYSLSVFVDNVLDDQTSLSLGNQVRLNNLTTAWQPVYDNKRTWGVVGRYKF
jgi:iron complex outermembrane receptor protein